MNRSQAIDRMIPPGAPRNKKRNQGVIQIHVTRSCDKSCFNCTQGSNLRGITWFMTPDQFETCCISLRDYFGTVGVFGGNPAVSPYFEDYCKIIQKYIPFSRRGLWCNNPLGKASFMRGVFNPAVSNLNCHLDQNAFDEFKRDWPECNPFGQVQDSRHSPVFVAMKDVIDNEETRWDLISDCDINKYWSALIGVFRGELRAWFCEIAGAQAMLHQADPDYPDTGLEVNDTWWKLPMKAFTNQVIKHCHECSVPLRGYGELACSSDPNSKEQVSDTHASIYNSKKKEREVQIVTTLEDLNSKALKFTDYLGGGSK